MNRYIVVGGGVAGTTAAQTLRSLDPAAAVALIEDEPYPYYYRPKLWEYLSGKAHQSELFFRPAEWYPTRNIDLRVGTKVVSIHPNRHRISLAAGDTLPYDRLLLCTGSCSFVPDIPGTDLPGVYALRTLDDASAIRTRALRSRRAVVVGGGLLGLETAHALCDLRLEVTVVEIAPHLLPRQLDREGADFLQARLESMGMTFVTGARTAAVAGEEDAAGVRLEDGRTIAGELVLFSTGVMPRVELARAAGIPIGRGILVDGSLQTSAADVFAAGDAAEFEGRSYGLIPPAIEQARAASQNMAGAEKTTYRGTLPSATLKLLGMDLTSLGEATAEDPTITARRVMDEKAGIYKKVVLRNGVLIGAILLNESASVPAFKRLIATRRNVSQVVEQLLDPEFDLEGFIA